MRLKCIKLSGFKSFVDPTAVQFPSNLCAVVGPNGCGKSNVIDAVRWVMGESSAKNLRGEQMTDVIFNGSGTRKPVGQASVELLFDNDDHRLQGEYAKFTEVSVKRRVDRDAQSTYFLNGTKCRRKDITDLFLGTGLGPRSYSIIEQGMISRLIESKPEELRIFIEEAAGISKYKERRKETESRIKRTKDNLERLHDIREELQKQLSHLQRQSVAAEKYGEYKQQERRMQANFNALRWQVIDRELQQQREKIRGLELEVEQIAAEQREIDAKIEQHLSDNAEFTDALGEVQAQFYSLGNDIARLEQSIEHHVERTDQLRLDLQETEEAWEQTREEMDVDLQKVIQMDEELGVVTPQLESAQQSAAAAAAELKSAENAQQQWQSNWEGFSQRAEEPRQTAEVEQSRIQQLESIIERGLERKKRLEDELAGLENERSVDHEAGQIQGQVEKLEKDLEQLQKEYTDSQGRIESLRQKDQTCNSELDKARSDLQASRGQYASLEALQKAALGEDDSKVVAWLQDRGLGKKPRLGQSLKVDSGWEAAVELVLGESLQSVCLDEQSDLTSLLKQLPDGMVSMLEAISSDEASKKAYSDKLQPLSAKIQSDIEMDDLLSGIFTAENFAEAISQRTSLAVGESIVTRQGVWLGRHWVRVRGNSETQAGILERKGRISALEQEIARLTKTATDLADAQSTIRRTIAKSESKREEVQRESSNKTRQLSELKAQLGAKQAKFEQTELRHQRLVRDLDEISRQLAVEQSNIAEARERLQQALDTMEQDVSKRQQLEEQRIALRDEVEQRKETYNKNQEISHQLELQHQSLTAQLSSTRQAMDRMASQVQRSKERMETLSDQIEKSQEPLLQMRSNLEQLLQARLGVEKDLTAAKKRVDDNEHAIRTLEHDRNSVERRLAETREKITQYRVSSEGASVRQSGLLEQLRDAKFDLQEVINELPEGLDEAACETELERLANRIQRLGPINLAAIDEYKQQSERKVYLDKQNEDLEKALTTLQNAIRKIDKETRTRFRETFDQVNNGLQTLFPKVFGGGHAYLDMTGEDLLDTGVAIMARPPGKRNSTIHLLSGGEKAMTAIALVFSIFQLNPSPFCMLDEVDAPLDDANVGRYANLVREMSKNVQFIFITHNKITMEMANQLLGVTMHEAGVSRIVAVDIEEAAELAAM